MDLCHALITTMIIKEFRKCQTLYIYSLPMFQGAAQLYQTVRKLTQAR